MKRDKHNKLMTLMSRSSKRIISKRKRDKLIMEIAEETGIHYRVVAAIIRSTGAAINKLMIRNVDIKTYKFDVVENRWGTKRRRKKLRERPKMTAEEKAVVCYLELEMEGNPKPKELLLIGRLASVSPTRSRNGIATFRTRLKEELNLQRDPDGSRKANPGRCLAKEA